MPQLLVPMSGQTLKDYWSARKAERKRAAQFYVDNPQVTVAMVMAKFHLSRHTVNKALSGNGIDVDRKRNPTYNANTYRQVRCRHCHDVHWCGTKPGEMGPVEAPAAQDNNHDELADTIISREDRQRMLAEMGRPPRA